MLKKLNAGFTLLELLVVMVIVSILAAVVIPGYTEQMRKSRRADAKTALMDLAQRQENYRVNFNQYASIVGSLGGQFRGVPNKNEGRSENGYYKLSVTNFTNNTFVLQAVPDTAGAQKDDEDCWTFTINQRGVKAATKKGGGDNPDCW